MEFITIQVKGKKDLEIVKSFLATMKTVEIINVADDATSIYKGFHKGTYNALDNPKDFVEINPTISAEMILQQVKVLRGKAWKKK
jgi:hypothetical protein